MMKLNRKFCIFWGTWELLIGFSTFNFNPVLAAIALTVGGFMILAGIFLLEDK